MAADKQQRQAGAEKTEQVRALVVGHTYVVAVNQSKLRELASRGGVQISLVVPESWPASELGRRFALGRSTELVDFHSSPVYWAGRNGAHFYSPLKVSRVFQSVAPRLVHVEQEVFSLCALEFAIMCRLFRIPLVICCQENVEKHHSWLRRLSRGWVLHVASCIVAGNAGAAELLRCWGYRGRIELMPQLGVDRRLFAPRFGRARGPIFRIGFVGRLMFSKGVDILLLAVLTLLERGRACELVLVGCGPHESQLRALAQRLGVDHAVSWRGWVTHEEVPEEMSRLDATVLPTRTIPDGAEQFGHVLIESMSMGIPTIGSTCGEIPRVIGRPDLVFPEGDAKALADVLERLILDATLWAEVGQYGIARVEEMFTSSKVAARLETVWHEVLNSENLG